MNAKNVWLALGVLVALIAEGSAPNSTLAQGLGFIAVSSETQQDQPKQAQPKQDQPKQDLLKQDKIAPQPKSSSQSSPETDRFAQDSSSPYASGQFLSLNDPQMMGDFSVYSVRRIIASLSTQTIKTVNTTTLGSPVQITTTTVKTATNQFFQNRAVWVPVATRGTFNIAENESPIPQDRVFITGNGFSDVRGPQPIVPLLTTRTTTTTTVNDFGSTTRSTVVNTVTPGGPTSVGLYREIFGFEKTFFDGAASVELRVPILQQTSDVNGFANSDFGDLTVIGKYAFYRDRATGNVISTGLAVTAPSSGGIQSSDGTIHSTLIQPFVGYLWNFDRFYIQAFHSVVIPTDPRDVTLMFNDVGLNYWLYRSQQPDSVLRCIVPTVEAHITTPLNHRNDSLNESVNNPLFLPDTVIITTGVHFGLYRNTTLSLGVATPVTGPRVFGVEGFVQLNWRF